MDIQKLFDKIHQAYPQLSKGHRKIADSIMESWENIAFISPKELGEKLGISEATVIRFAKELGYDNYSELRRYIRDLLKYSLTPAEKMTTTVDKIKDDHSVQKILATEFDILKEGIQKISFEEFSRAVNLLEKARRIFIIGFGVSASLCHFLEFRFQRMQIDTHILTHGGKSFFEKLLLANEEDVIIGIGFFRCAREILIAFDYAKKHSIATIAVTHSSISDLAKLATVTLVANRGPVKEVNSLVVPMAVLNALVIALAQREGPRSLEALGKLDQINALYQDDEEIDIHD